MNYSKIHSHIAEYDAIDREEILNKPENYFGPNYQTVLNFWWFVESLQEEHLKKITELYDKEFELSGWEGESRVLNNTEQRIGQDFLSSAIGDSIWEEIPDLDNDIRIRHSRHGAIFHATCELIAMDIIFKRGESLVYVPMFDFAKEQLCITKQIERLEVTSTGNVSLATTNPQARLRVGTYNYVHPDPHAFNLNGVPIRNSLEEAYRDLLIERQALWAPYMDFINAEYPPIRNQNANNDRFYLQE